MIFYQGRCLPPELASDQWKGGGGKIGGIGGGGIVWSGDLLYGKGPTTDKSCSCLKEGILRRWHKGKKKKAYNELGTVKEVLAREKGLADFVERTLL